MPIDPRSDRLLIRKKSRPAAGRARAAEEK